MSVLADCGRPELQTVFLYVPTVPYPTRSFSGNFDDQKRASMTPFSHLETYTNSMILAQSMDPRSIDPSKASDGAELPAAELVKAAAGEERGC